VFTLDSLWFYGMVTWMDYFIAKYVDEMML